MDKLIITVAPTGNVPTKEMNPHLPVTPETLEFVSDLPDSLKLERAGVGILMAHGTTWSDFVYLYPQTRQSVYQRVADGARAAQATASRRNGRQQAK